MSKKTTLAQRGSKYFGENNTKYLTPVKLGQDRVAFVSTSKLWLYEEFPTCGIAINLTPLMRANLMRALDGVNIHGEPN